MNMKIIRQGYVVRSSLKLILNILKEMKGPTSIYTLLGAQMKEAFNETFMCALRKKHFENVTN